MCFYLKQHYIFNFPSLGTLCLKISGLCLKDEPTCSDSKQIQRKHCILPLWMRGSEPSLMVSVCHLGSWAAGEVTTFLGENVHRAMSYRWLVQLLLKQPSSHKHQKTVVLCQGAPPRSMEHLPQHLRLISTTHCDTGMEVSPRGGRTSHIPCPQRAPVI